MIAKVKLGGAAGLAAIPVADISIANTMAMPLSVRETEPGRVIRQMGWTAP